MNTNVAPTATVRVTRLIKASRDRVFAAWTTPEIIPKWFGSETCKFLSAKVDLKVGGEYRFRVHSAGCSGGAAGEKEVYGIFREVKKPARLVYSWNSSGKDRVEVVESIVTVDFLDKEGFTEVQILHDLLPTEEQRQGHSQGWNVCLDNLAKLAEENSGSCSQPGTFCWNELLAADVGAATSFYTKLFGWSTEQFPGNKDYTLFKHNGEQVGGMMPQPNKQGPPQWLPYIAVEDVDASAKKAADLGAKICMPPMDIPTVGRIAVLMDPQGSAVGIFQPAQKV